METLTLLAIIAALLAIATLAFGQQHQQKLRIKEQAQLAQLEHVLNVFANENDGRYPVPGLLDRKKDPEFGRQVPGRGPEDTSLNHTAPLYSMMICQNYITPALVVSPAEVNPFVRVMPRQDYNYDAYNPIEDNYWDDSFTVRIDKKDPGSNASYAHMAICGAFKTKHWRNTMNADRPVLGTRGPEDGATEGDAFTRSPTLRFFQPHDRWVGAVMGTQRTWFARPDPDALQSEDAGDDDAEDEQRFNLFTMAGGGLSISIASTEDSVTRIWDPLDPVVDDRVQSD